MKKIILSMLAILSGCDSIQGLRMPITPAFIGSWSCALENLDEIGAKGNVGQYSQLSISGLDNNYMFTASPRENNTLELYYLYMNSLPSCEEAANSFSKMQEFIKLMEAHCAYKPESVEANMQCGSNKANH